MKKKGFTLIELLAVIIILAIIALIATPIVLNVIEDSKELGRQSSVAMYADAVRLKVTEDWFKNGYYPMIDTAYLETVTTQGEKVTCEEVYYSKVFESVLHKCHVGKNDKEYYYAANELFDSPEDESYKNIYESVSSGEKGPDLAETLLKQYNESNTVGLLKDETGYYYKGSNEEVSNNFVWWGGHLWRVISIDNDNNLTMITQQPLTTIFPSRDVWKTEQLYKESYINTWLHEVFLESIRVSDILKIQDNIYNVGDKSNVASIQIVDKAGLLDLDQYTKAGLANSFLDIKNEFWSGNSSGASNVCEISATGDISTTRYPSTISGVRPVIKVSNLTIVNGNGTLENPYRESHKTVNTTNIAVGEYINISTTGTDCGSDNKCLFRVVSKDDDSIKVILNGMLYKTSKFASSSSEVKYTKGNIVDNVITTFANTIDSKYRYTENNKIFGIGTYGAASTNYKFVQSLSYTGSVGLPVIGEMFTGNDINLSTSTTKTFVNVSTIENPTVSNYSWTMSPYNTSRVRLVTMSGTMGYDSTTSANVNTGVRPVLFLKQGLTFTGGDGTAENPFILE